MLEGHSDAVTAVSIVRPRNMAVQSGADLLLATASKDRTLRLWKDCRINLWLANEFDAEGDLVSIKKRRKDTENEDSQSEYCGKVINYLDVGGKSSALIAVGGSDPILRIWDPSKPGTLAPVFQFSSHASWISACKWHDKSWFHLVSASYDGKVMLWDLRTVWPLAVINSHKDKVLCVDWWKDDYVISGGVDSKLCISSEISVQ
ncbi:unnamed protein product [Ilex paraguariensis]|uniref:Uncharacterized protein n=1 Tax=Ilex paraguariensis TaxID=185542 RepID=A0ABC8RY14_9AQUA